MNAPIQAAPPESTLARKPRTAMAGFAWGVVCALAFAGIAWYASTSTRDEPNVDAQIAQAMQKPAAALPPDHPPFPGSEATIPAAGVAQPIHITLSLEPSTPPRGGTIYVIARGVEGGHPIAVRRIETNDFPVIFDFGAEDSMMGSALPEKVRIEARLDSDSDAMTSDPADLRAHADGVRGGTSIEMTLAKAN